MFPFSSNGYSAMLGEITVREAFDRSKKQFAGHLSTHHRRM
jgi:hypothetical protein